MSTRSLETVELTKSFGGVTAVDHASVTFQHGKVNGLIGPNGSGKTTFFNCVTGMIKPDSGTVSYRGSDITGKPSDAVARAGIGRSFQLCRIFPADDGARKPAGSSALDERAGAARVIPKSR